MLRFFYYFSSIAYNDDAFRSGAYIIYLRLASNRSCVTWYVRYYVEQTANGGTIAVKWKGEDIPLHSWKNDD